MVDYRQEEEEEEEGTFLDFFSAKLSVISSNDKNPVSTPLSFNFFF